MRRMLLGVCTALLSGCIEVGPDFQAPALSGREAALFDDRPAGGVASADWWTRYRNPTLDAEVEEALRQSPTLQSAEAKLRQAAELLDAGRGVLWPSVSAQYQASRTTTSPTSSAPSVSFNNLFTAGAGVAYQFDLWGGQHRSVEALAAQADYAGFQRDAARLSLIGSVVAGAINVAAFADQVAARQDIVEREERALALVEARVKVGSGARLDILSARSQLESGRSALAQARQSFAVARHALAVLLGRPPEQSFDPHQSLRAFVMPEQLPSAVASDVVAQRPDLAAQLALMRAASANIGVATANLLPQINLTASFGAQSSGGGMAGAPALVNLVGNATQVLFDHGTLLARRSAAVAAYDDAAATYRDTLLRSFQNVADALDALDHDGIALQEARVAAEDAEAATNLTEQRLRLGTVDVTTLLVQQRLYEEARIALLTAQARHLTDAAQLFQAIGAGERSETPSVALAPQASAEGRGVP